MSSNPYARYLRLVGLLTWAFVTIMVVPPAWKSGLLTSPMGLLWGACLAGFLVCFIIATRPGCGPVWFVPLIAAESILALVVIGLYPSAFLPVILVIVSGQIGRLPLAVGLTWIAVQTAALWAVLPSADSVAIAGAFFAFQLFGVFSTSIAHSEARMHQALAESNAELKVATRLLDISSRSEERLRIARELHDLLGHHLTALSLNLEVAGHLADEATREPIEKSKALTKTLLTDVREVVSRLRDQEPVSLSAAAASLRDVVDRPAVHLDLESDLAVSDPAIARVALRALQEIVTNSVRHSGARNLWLTLSTEHDTLAIGARDDGAGTDDIRFGNGLRGMRERVEEVSGTLTVSSMRGRGFEVQVRIPLEATA
jgi:signal transduction histidine kinase